MKKDDNDMNTFFGRKQEEKITENVFFCSRQINVAGKKPYRLR